MSEVTYLECDVMGCDSRVLAYPSPGTPEEALRGAWVKDDMDSDVCLKCQKALENIEANTADAESLAAFGAAVGAAADKALEAVKEQEVSPLAQVSEAEFDKLIETAIKDLRKSLKKQKQTPEYIAEAIQALKDQAQALKPKAIQ